MMDWLLRIVALASTVTWGLFNEGKTAVAKEKHVRLRWMTAQDERACEECMALNDTIYDHDEGPRPPLHPSCRCEMVVSRD